MATQQMSKTDRSELRRILKLRMEILREQVVHREIEVRDELRKAIQKEYAETVKQAKADTKKLKEKAQKFEAEAEELEKRYGALGLSNSPYQRRSYDLMRIDFSDDWQPENLEEKVNEAYSALTRKAGAVKLDLKQTELALSEELAINGLTTDEAKDFLAKIPTVEKLIPLESKEVKELIASTKEK